MQLRVSTRVLRVGDQRLPHHLRALLLAPRLLDGRARAGAPDELLAPGALTLLQLQQHPSDSGHPSATLEIQVALLVGDAEASALVGAEPSFLGDGRLNVYSHVVPGMQEEVADRIDEVRRGSRRR